MRILGSGLIATSCVLACAVGASIVGWVVVMGLAFGGGRLWIGSVGCATAPVGGASAKSVDPAGRRRRAAIGTGALALAGVAALLATRGWLEAVPIAALATWFGASFVVAAWTGYAGCPELGAIPSLFRRQPLATACPPLDTRPTGGPSRGCGC